MAKAIELLPQILALAGAALFTLSAAISLWRAF